MNRSDLILALETYFADWQTYTDELKAASLQEVPYATAAGWKVATQADLAGVVADWTSQCTQIHVGAVDDRLIASLLLVEPLSAGGVQVPVIKVMQRRPGSSDRLGLDHVDFMLSDMQAAQDALTRAKATWEVEANSAHTWVSVRFGGTPEDTQSREAKFVDHTVLEVCAKELAEAGESLKPRFSTGLAPSA